MKIKVKANTNQVINQMRQSLKKYRGGRVHSKIFNDVHYAGYVERGDGSFFFEAPSESSGKEEFEVGFEPRYMVRKSTQPTDDFLRQTIPQFLTVPQTHVTHNLEGVLELTTEFGFSTVLQNTPKISGDLREGFKRTAIKSEIK